MEKITILMELMRVTAKGMMGSYTIIFIIIFILISILRWRPRVWWARSLMASTLPTSPTRGFPISWWAGLDQQSQLCHDLSIQLNWILFYSIKLFLQEGSRYRVYSAIIFQFNSIEFYYIQFNFSFSCWWLHYISHQWSVIMTIDN